MLKDSRDSLNAGAVADVRVDAVSNDKERIPEVIYCNLDIYWIVKLRQIPELKHCSISDDKTLSREMMSRSESVPYVFH